VDSTRLSFRECRLLYSRCFLRFLEKNPRSSSPDIRKALFTPKTTIRCLLTNLGLTFRQACWIRQPFSEQQKAEKVAFSQEMLQTMSDLEPKQHKYLITGDETWIFWDNNHRGMWVQDGEEVPANVKRMMSSTKTILSAYFSRTGFVSVEFLPQEQKYNSQFFTETILPSLVARLPVRLLKPKARAAHLHLDNAKPHDSRLSLEKMEEHGFIRVPQPSYSPDLALCDFFLFGYLKVQLEGKTFFDEDSVKEEVRRILMEIPVTLLHSVMDEWIQR
jgi:hypothetical protein